MHLQSPEYLALDREAKMELTQMKMIELKNKQKELEKVIEEDRATLRLKQKDMVTRKSDEVKYLQGDDEMAKKVQKRHAEQSGVIDDTEGRLSRNQEEFDRL